MYTWNQLFSNQQNIPPSLLQWWLSDYLDCSLTNLPLKETPSDDDLEIFERASERLRKGEPVQYVCGRAPFRDIEVKVDARVLIPRPETEQLVQIALDRFIKSADRILDIGTGSGCIALSIKHARPDCQVEGRDVSEEALDLARENATSLGLDVTFKQADVLEGEPFRSSELIIANLPYIGTEEAKSLPENVHDFEPHIALFSGPKGADLILTLINQAKEVLIPGGHLLLETGETQGAFWKQAAQEGGWELEGLKDLAGRERFWIFSM